MSESTPQARTTAKSVSAVARGIIVVFALSLGTDQLLHMFKVYPPWGQPMYDASLNILALSYRIIYGIVGGYVTARFSPRNPMRHAMMLGYVGFGLSALGVIGNMSMPEIGPLWYPVAILITAIPCAWLGGILQSRRNA